MRQSRSPNRFCHLRPIFSRSGSFALPTQSRLSRHGHPIRRLRQHQRVLRQGLHRRQWRGHRHRRHDWRDWRGLRCARRTAGLERRGRTGEWRAGVGRVFVGSFGCHWLPLTFLSHQDHSPNRFASAPHRQRPMLRPHHPSRLPEGLGRFYRTSLAWP